LNLEVDFKFASNKYIAMIQSHLSLNELSIGYTWLITQRQWRNVYTHW